MCIAFLIHRWSILLLSLSITFNDVVAGCVYRADRILQARDLGLRRSTWSQVAVEMVVVLVVQPNWQPSPPTWDRLSPPSAPGSVRRASASAQGPTLVRQRWPELGSCLLRACRMAWCHVTCWKRRTTSPAPWRHWSRNCTTSTPPNSVSVPGTITITTTGTISADIFFLECIFIRCQNVVLTSMKDLNKLSHKLFFTDWNRIVQSQ